MAVPDALFELRAARGYPVIVLISAVDRRILPTLRFVARLPFAQLRAVHVSVDPEETSQVASAWMTLGLSWLPLYIWEGAQGGIAATIREALEGEDKPGNVTVVVPELNMPRWWHGLLHRQTARRVAAQLQPIDGVTTVIVPFTVPDPDRHQRLRGGLGGDHPDGRRHPVDS